MRSLICDLNIDLVIGGFTANYFISELYKNSHHFRYEIIADIYDPIRQHLKDNL